MTARNALKNLPVASAGQLLRLGTYRDRIVCAKTVGITGIVARCVISYKDSRRLRGFVLYVGILKSHAVVAD